LEPLPAEPGTRAVIFHDDALTVFDDGSMSVVTSAGRIVDVAPLEGERPGMILRNKESLCSFDAESAYPGWVWDHPDYGHYLVSFGSMQLVSHDGDWSAVPHGTVFDAVERDSKVGFELQADEAVAPYLVIQLSAVEVFEGEQVTIGTQLTAEPELSDLGGAGVGTAAVEVHSDVLEYDSSGYCVADDYPKGKTDYSLSSFLIADVWLTDR